MRTEPTLTETPPTPAERLALRHAFARVSLLYLGFFVAVALLCVLVALAATATPAGAFRAARAAPGAVGCAAGQSV